MARGAPPTLVSLQVSPWSLKARWALKHHHLRYKTQPYTPVLGELLLRWQTWRWTGKVTVPVLIVSKNLTLWDSFDIALWADGQAAVAVAASAADAAAANDAAAASTPLVPLGGGGAAAAAAPAVRLIPKGAVAEVRRWNMLSDDILFYGRQQLQQLVLQDRELLLKYLPPMLRNLGPLSDLIAFWGVARFGAKYSVESGSASRAKAVAALDALREGLRRGGGRYLVNDQFSYADVVMCAALQSVKAVGPPYNRTAGARPLFEVWGPDSGYEDLLAWRDGIFKAHFPLEDVAKAEAAGAGDGRTKEA